MAAATRTAAADFAIVGLGRMGENLARQALEKGLRVGGYTKGPRPRLRNARFSIVKRLVQLPPLLSRPRKILLYVPAGAAVDAVLDELLPVLERGDIVMDGGNSYWGDSIRRARRLRAAGIHFLDVGTSGGIEGARHGACTDEGAGGNRDEHRQADDLTMHEARERRERTRGTAAADERPAASGTPGGHHTNTD